MSQLPDLPQELYQQFAPVFGQLSHAQQSAISDIAHSVLIRPNTCAEYIEVLLRRPDDMDCITSLLLPHSAQHRVDLVTLFHQASSGLVRSMLSDATQEQVVRLLKLVDCFEGAEFSQLLMVLEDLGYSTFTRLLTEYPRPKPCHRSEEHTSELQSLMRISY